MTSVMKMKFVYWGGFFFQMITCHLENQSVLNAIAKHRATLFTASTMKSHLYSVIAEGGQMLIRSLEATIAITESCEKPGSMISHRLI